MIPVNEYPVIDLSELAPLGCILTPAKVAERLAAINEQIPDSTIEANDNKNGNWNAQMSSRFQVMRDCHSIGYTDWVSAYNACKQYNKEGGRAGQWRLPTQRELMMIWILHPQLLGK